MCEDAVTDRMCQSGLQSFTLAISLWMMLHSRVEQLKLIVIKSIKNIQNINWEQSTLYHVGDSWHTPNI